MVVNAKNNPFILLRLLQATIILIMKNVLVLAVTLYFGHCQGFRCWPIHAARLTQSKISVFRVNACGTRNLHEDDKKIKSYAQLKAASDKTQESADEVLRHIDRNSQERTECSIASLSRLLDKIGLEQGKLQRTVLAAYAAFAAFISSLLVIFACVLSMC